MGIKGLMKFLADNAPSALHVEARASLLGRVVAVDASLALYQFLTAVRDAQTLGNLTDEAGNITSHLAGMLARVTRMLEQGIRPVYVFDGVPPEEKSEELKRRQERREEAEALAAAAREAGDTAELRKQLTRTVRVTKQQNEDVKRLLTLLGVPVVSAPAEAEAQCAALAKANKVWGAATEDADALTFGAPIVIRNLTFSDSSSSNSSSSSSSSSSNGGSAAGAAAAGKGHPVVSIHLNKVLEELKLTMPQFIDFCILCGCDYCGTIKGIGPKTAYNLLLQHNSIEGVLQHIDKDKHSIPDPFPFESARKCFTSPLVADTENINIKWAPVDEQGLKDFLVHERTFSEARVDSYIQRLRKAKGLCTQTRLESFFGAAVSKPSDLIVKQKAEANKAQQNKNNKRPNRTFKTPPAKRR